MRPQKILSNSPIVLVLVLAILSASIGLSLSKAEASPAMTGMKRATTTSGASSTIDSYFDITSLDLYRLSEDVITSNCSIDIRVFRGQVQGNVTYVCDVYCMGDPPTTNTCPYDGEDCCAQTINGTVIWDPDGVDWWPETWAMVKYFSSLAEDQGAVHLTGDVEIDLVDPSNINLGPLYVEGDLDITSSVNDAHTALNGTVYVSGHLTVGGPKDFTLDLNDQIIFVECNDESPQGAIRIDNQCTIEGTGAIIAIGDSFLEPKLTTGPDDFIFIMSVEGGISLQTMGDFYGSIAGNDYVDVWPGNNIIHTDGDDFWNTFPATTLISIRIPAGWNMVSMPAMSTYNSTSAVFPGAAGIFTWNATSRSYYVPTTIEPDKGYWIAVTEDTTFFVGGTPIEIWTTDIKAGWNMIGSVSINTSMVDPNDTRDGSIIPTAYWWDPVSRAYTTTTDINPGKGYWAASIQDCTLTLP